MTDFLPPGRPLFLEAIPIPDNLRLVVLAPHPDDFDAVAVTLRFFSDRGSRIDLAVATSGASGVEDAFCPDPSAKAALREEEQRASAKFFGLPEERLVFLRLEEDEEGHPVETAAIGEANAGRVRQYLAGRQPQIVFLPHWNDTNAGHRRIYAMFRPAAQAIAREAHQPVIAFLNRDPKTIQMRHDLYTIFGEEDAAWKGELLRYHRSQHERNLRARGHGFDERILQVNRQIGAELRPPAAYAEAFEVEVIS